MPFYGVSSITVSTSDQAVVRPGGRESSSNGRRSVMIGIRLICGASTTGDGMEYKTCRCLSVIVFCCLLLFPVMPVAAGKPYILAVHPYLPVAEILQRFHPLADYLAQKLGRPVSVRVGGNYEEHIEAIGGDKVDIAFLGPVSYVSVVDRFGPKPLLARFQVNNEPYLYGVIAVRQESRLQKLTELKDKRFAFGDPDSTMSHIVPRYLLIQAGIPRGLPKYYQFLGSHKNVALGILAGDYDAGAMKQEVFDEFKSQGLRALAFTPGVPDHLFVTRADLPAAEIELLRQALQQLQGVPGGPKILSTMHQGLTALVPANDAEYGALRRMFQAVSAVTP